MNPLHAFLHAHITIHTFLGTVPTDAFSRTRKWHEKKRLLFVMIYVKVFHRGFLFCDYRRRLEF